MKGKISDKHGRLVESLRGRFGGPGWVFLKNVANRIGKPSNYADAVAVNLYRSRGWHLHGIECKTSASDLLHEIVRPEKADAVGQYMDYWWLAVDDAGILTDTVVAKVPPAWGILTVDKAGRCHQVRAASKLEPVPLERGFLFALLVRAQEAYESGKLGAVKDASYSKGYRDGEAHVRLDADWRERRAKELEARVLEFQKRSGLDIDRYDAGDIGAAVALLRHDDPLQRAKWMRGLFADELKRLDDAIGGMERGRAQV